MGGGVFDAWLSMPCAVEAFAAPSLIQAMLDFEAALAQAQAAEGLVPATVADAIAARCRRELHDVASIEAAAARAGSLAVPLVAALKQQVAAHDASALPWVNWGATAQDVTDTAVAMVTQRVKARLDDDLGRLTGALLSLARREAGTAMLARTQMQPASATTLGFKIAGWVAPLLRARSRIGRAAYDALQVQLGGVAGTLAVMGPRGPAVAERMAERLALALPSAAWHTQRDAWVSLGSELAVLVGSLGMIARELSLLGQAEVGELTEPAAAAGSGKVPVRASLVALAAAQRAPAHAAALLAAMPQEHSLGGWQAELAEWTGLWTSAAGAVAALADAAPGWILDRDRMRSNLEAHRGHFEIDDALAAARERTAAWLEALRALHERQR